jgi:hypothetical protein
LSTNDRDELRSAKKDTEESIEFGIQIKLLMFYFTLKISGGLRLGLIEGLACMPGRFRQKHHTHRHAISAIKIHESSAAGDGPGDGPGDGKHSSVHPPTERRIVSSKKEDSFEAQHSTAQHHFSIISAV